MDLHELKEIESESIHVITWDRIDSDKTKILRKSLDGCYSVVTNTNGEVDLKIKTKSIIIALNRYNELGNLEEL